MIDYSIFSNEFLSIEKDGVVRAKVQEGLIRESHTDRDTSASQQYHRVPVQKYVSYGAAHKVDKYGERVYPDTGKNSIPFGTLPGNWKSRSEAFRQETVDDYLSPESPRYNPANYERLMAQARCDAYDELVASRESGQYVWDTLSPEDRAALRASNPQRAEALELDFFTRIEDEDGNFYEALKYGYTIDEIENPYVYNPRESKDLPNEGKTIQQEIQEMERSEEGIRTNPYLSYDEELTRLRKLDEEQLRTGIHSPQKMYAENDGFAGESLTSDVKSGDYISRWEGLGRSGDRGRFTTRAEKGADGIIHSPSFQQRSMVEAEDEMEESLFKFVRLPPPESVTEDQFKPLSLTDIYGLDPNYDAVEEIPPIQEMVDTDSGKSTGEVLGLGAVIGTGTTLTQNEARSESSSAPTAGSASLRDRYQSSYADRIRQTPSLESNRWVGERGESVCAPQSDAARQIMEERGISGVQYQDGAPDFSPFSESTVKLGYMTDARHSQGLTAGRDGKDTIYAHFEDGETVSESHHADKSSMADLHMKYDKPGNFEQADALTAEQWTADGRDGKKWAAEDVAQYRQDHGLTWHECNDMETMQMIPEAINADFGHLGGVGEVKETQRIVDDVLRDYDEGQMVEAEDYDRMTPEELEATAREHGHYADDGVWVPDDRSVEPVEEKKDQDMSDEQAVEDSNPDNDEGYLKVEHGEEETGTRIDDIAAQTEGDDLPDNNTSLAEETSDDIKDAIPDESKETGASGEQAVDQMETVASDENLEQTTQDLQKNTSDSSVEDAISDTRPVDSIESTIPTEDVDQLEQAGQEPREAVSDTSAEDVVPDEQTLDHVEDVVNPDEAEQATQDLQEVTTDASAAETATVEQAVDQMESVIPSEEMDQLEQATQGRQENIPEASAEDAATEAHADDQMEDAAVLSDDVGQTEEDVQELRENTPDASAGDTMADEQSVNQMEAAIPDDDVTQSEQVTRELQDGAPDNSVEGAVSDDQAVDQMNGSVADEDMGQVEGTSQELQEDIPDPSIPDDGVDRLEQAACEQGAEERATRETTAQEAEEQAAREAVEQEAEEQVAQEAANQVVEEQAEQEAAEQEAEEQAAQEAAEQEAEEQAAQEAAEQEAEGQAAQEAAEQEAEEQAAQEAYDDFSDEQAEEAFVDAEEDYSDLADEPTEEAYNDSDYSDLADEAAEDYVDDSADYSDMADDIDSGSYDDSSFDSSDASFDSGDTGSFDGGGDSIE